MSETCPACGQGLPPVPASVKVWGMYDCHLFTHFEGSTVDEVVAAWREHNATPNPATVGGREVADLGTAVLCAISVQDAAGKSLRRVGLTVSPHVRGSTYYTQDKEAEDLRAWRDAVEADPDIVRLLAERTS